MTDLVPYEPRVNRLIEWAHEADAAYALAQKLTDTAFCPPQFRRRPDDAMAAMLAGSEVGLSPLAALNAFDVIEGRAAPRAITLRALTIAAGHEIVLEESTATRCKMRGRRKGAAEWQTVTWTIARADSLKLTNKANWRTQPDAMLIARATSELCRLIAADAILGIGGGYSAEEYGDGGQTPAPNPVTATPDRPPVGMRRMGRTPVREDPITPEPDAPTGTPPVEHSMATPPPADPTPPTPPLTAVERALRHVGGDPVEVDLPPPVHPVEAEAVEVFGRVLGAEVVETPTPEQRRKMFALFADAGWDNNDRSAEGRQARLDYVGNIIERKILSSNELTKAEMSMVIDALEADVQATTWTE
jgi:hypothetical protein